ncbi:hypothetical protein E4U17_000713 [Claviceps sp. LM77 group G4]|nr:hypothetical protein E4U17_000713 [Claviceps sp. LM77 group G4]KAG6077520.1 hypothetical protein E4U33_001245 [Claviceps sp. LM78 group G4]KAG6084768.1 hypothetical protein E4U16_001135 [Claviceps sp. LM84 group G4]
MVPRKNTVLWRSDLQVPEPSATAHITDVKNVSSYSWIDTPRPTIVVPGTPPLWSPPATDVQLPKDSGLYSIEENAIRLPGSPMAPMLRAIFTTNPSFDVRSIDVISDRHNIRKLLTFIDPGSDRQNSEQFTIRLELVGHTLLLCRHEKVMTRYIGRNQYLGYGFEFMKAYTASQIDDSAGHFRIVSYRFCGLNFLICHEPDGFVSPETESVEDIAHEGVLDRPKSPTRSRNERPPSSSTVDPSLKNVIVRHKGETVPLESIFDIKTRTRGKGLRFRHIAPQLWLSQTSKLVRAFHEEGRFQKPRVEDVEDKLKKWELNNEENLRKLGALIGKIITVMKQKDRGGRGRGGRGILRFDIKKGCIMIVRDMDESGMLPEDLYSKWDE